MVVGGEGAWGLGKRGKGEKGIQTPDYGMSTHGNKKERIRNTVKDIIMVMHGTDGSYTCGEDSVMCKNLLNH